MKDQTKMVENALEFLNFRYGIGDIVSVDHEQRTFTRKGYQMKPETRRFSVVGHCVYALGHQKTFRGPLP